ncbi:MAG: IS66 family transposase [Planctomycetota bacterium]|nr:IS66 family transposase [Planctomycetota bacterium]
MNLTYCPECLKKQQRINELEEEVVQLKARLRYQERTAAEGPFGSSTPSSKVPVKPDTLPERQARRGGARAGHVGHGRASVPPEEADRMADVPVTATTCPHCGETLLDHGKRRRTVFDLPPVRRVRIVYRLARKRCPRCGRTVQARPPGVPPKGLFGNGLLVHVATQHYLYGVPLGTLTRQLGVGIGSLMKALHQLAGLLAAVIPRLVRGYREAPVKHADETGWRNDGQNGYGWFFGTPDLSLFRFRRSRAAAVAREVLGKKRLRGVLVVDRYSAYNKTPCRIQYCYAHLLRDVQDLEKKFPQEPEVQRFVATLAPLLAQAMRLRTEVRHRGRFRREASRLRRRIETVAKAPARHPAIQARQDLFRQKADRLYHWTGDPAIPAENNRAERALRPLVIARKVSFGSQSEAGARTREILMTVLQTLALRTADPPSALKSCLDHLALHPHARPFHLLFGKPRPPTRK